MIRWAALTTIIIIGLVVLFTKSNSPQTINPSPTTTLEQVINDQYVPYSVEAVVAATDKQKLLFFHANWCPTCRVTNQDILENSQDLPKDLIIFKTDYDSQTALKQKYNITYQHTFVLIDNQGNELKQWNGGGVEEINQQLI